MNREQPCSALRGDGQELTLYSDRVVVRNIGVGAVLFGRCERTICFDQIGDVFLFENITHNERLIKLTLLDEELPIVLAYPHNQEAAAKFIRDFLDANVHHEGMRSIPA